MTNSPGRDSNAMLSTSQPSPDVVRRKAHVRAWFDDLQVVLVRWYGMSAKDYARRGVRMESPTVLRFYEPLESEKGR